MNRHVRRSLLWVASFILLGQTAGWSDEFRIERGRMHDILNIVANDVEKHYYDPKLKGLDWKALTAQGHQQIDKAQSVSDMITAIFNVVYKLKDSHTAFLPPGRVQRPIFGFEAKAYGNEIRVYRIKKDGPAIASGLQVGDRILRVNNFDAERSTYDTMMLFFRVIRPASQLQIVYQHGTEPPKTTQIEVKMKQGNVIEDLTSNFDFWQLVRDSESPTFHFWAAFNDAIGYMYVPSFGSLVPPEVHKLNNPKALIVDLRGNPGGRIDTLLDLAGHFVAEHGKLADMVRREKTEPMKLAPSKPSFAALPVIVMVDSESSSAAEIFARFIQNRGNGVVLGDHTLGRVMAANVFPGHVGIDTIVPFATYISIGKVVFPDGTELEQKGVVPDVACTATAQDLAANQDSCLMLAVSIAKEKLGLDKELSDETRSQVASLAKEMAEKYDTQYQNMSIH